MNARIVSGSIAAVAIVAAAGRASTDPAGPGDRVERMVRQLGDRSFTRREAASRDLVAIGEPAMGALRVAASSDSDPEVRARADRVINSIAARARECELAKWDGLWQTAEKVWLKIDGHRWSSATPTWGPNGGTMWVVEVGPSFVAADLLVEYGPNKGQTCQAIFKVDGDRLRCCSTYMATRAPKFQAAAGYYLFEFDRDKK